MACLWRHALGSQPDRCSVAARGGDRGMGRRRQGHTRGWCQSMRPGPRMESRSSSRSTLADLRRASSTSTATCSRDCRATFSLTRGLRAAVNSPCCRRRRSRVTNVAWSPDGTKLAYLVFRSPRGADTSAISCSPRASGRPSHARPDSDHAAVCGSYPRLVLFVLRIGNVPRVRDGYIRLSTSGHGRPWSTRGEHLVCRPNMFANARSCPRVPPMVRRGSTVRVRQRASRFSCSDWRFVCRSGDGWRLQRPRSVHSVDVDRVDPGERVERLDRESNRLCEDPRLGGSRTSAPTRGLSSFIKPI
jgi:hypothetical protein